MFEKEKGRKEKIANEMLNATMTLNGLKTGSRGIS